MLFTKSETDEVLPFWLRLGEFAAWNVKLIEVSGTPWSRNVLHMTLLPGSRPGVRSIAIMEVSRTLGTFREFLQGGVMWGFGMGFGFVSWRGLGLLKVLSWFGVGAFMGVWGGEKLLRLLAGSVGVGIDPCGPVSGRPLGVRSMGVLWGVAGVALWESWEDEGRGSEAVFLGAGCMDGPGRFSLLLSMFVPLLTSGSSLACRGGVDSLRGCMDGPGRFSPLLPCN